MHQALGSIPHTTKQKQKQNNLNTLEEGMPTYVHTPSAQYSTGNSVTFNKYIRNLKTIANKIKLKSTTQINSNIIL
jgi:hypothetical protein